MILISPGTSSIESFSFTGPDGAKIHLIDTPGLDDSDGSDLETIQGLAEWLKGSSSRNIKLSGVLYLHKIIDNRMSNSSQENLELFQAICGDSCWSATALVTTMWDHVEKTTGDQEEYEKREYELRREEKYWGSLVKGGAKVLRYHNTKSSALEIINEITGLNQIIVPKLLQEVAVENRSITETTAFQHLPERYAQEQQRLQEKIDKLERYIGNGQGSHLKLEREVTRLENKLRASQDQQYELNRKVIELQRAKKDSLYRVGEIALPVALAVFGEVIRRDII
ncbi:hypothetical protein E8E14_006365 [Neopestalotiopsis sp. 37M]|nr:hypothetical protein E8E14_006365 [Neopestalotiopsis sp. 37M]